MKHVYAGREKKSCFWPYENTWALDGGSAGQGLSLNSSPEEIWVTLVFTKMEDLLSTIWKTWSTNVVFKHK